MFIFCRFYIFYTIYLLFSYFVVISQAVPVPLSLSANPNEPLTLYNRVRIVSISTLDTSLSEFDVDLFIVQSWFLNQSVCNRYADIHNSYTYKTPLIAVDGALTIIEPDVLSQIWLPKIHIAQVKAPINPTFTSTADGFVIIYPQPDNHHCMVKFMRRLSIKVQCELDFRRFPKDTQNCPVDFTSENAKWLTLNFTFKRKIGHFFLEITIPTIFIIISAYFSFFIPIERGCGRFTFSARPLFNLIFLYSSYKTYLPPLSYVNAGDVWILGNLCFGFVTIIAAVFPVQARQTKEEAINDSSNNQMNPSNITSNGNRLTPDCLTGPFTVIPGDNFHTSRCNCHRFRRTFILKHFRFLSCRVHPLSNNVLKKSHYYDKIMRFIYPLAFMIFNMVYWMYLFY